jgi:hypothetical protein
MGKWCRPPLADRLVAARAVSVAPALGAGARFVVGTTGASDTEWPTGRAIEVGRALDAEVVHAAGPIAIARAICVDAAVGADFPRRLDIRKEDADFRGAVVIDRTRFDPATLLSARAATIDVRLAEVPLAVMTVIDTLAVFATVVVLAAMVTALDGSVTRALLLALLMLFPSPDGAFSAEEPGEQEAEALP